MLYSGDRQRIVHLSHKWNLIIISLQIGQILIAALSCPSLPIPMTTMNTTTAQIQMEVEWSVCASSLHTVPALVDDPLRDFAATWPRNVSAVLVSLNTGSDELQAHLVCKSCFKPTNLIVADSVVKCGSLITLNNTYWHSSHWIGAETSCALTISLDHHAKEQSRPICQVRLDFITFSIAQPDKETACSVDTFHVGGAVNKVPVICGDNHGQHSKFQLNLTVQ